MTADRRPPQTWDRDERAVAWVYGSILVAAAVAVVTVKASESGQVLLYAAAAMTSIWLAHSFAAFVGHGGRVDLPGVRARAWQAMRAELPVLESAIPTLVSLAICWLVDARVATAGLVGLVVAISTMVVVSARAAHRTGARPLAVAAAAASAAALGGIIVALKATLG